jgi:hypothetical protein
MTRRYIKESDFIDMMKCYNNEDHYSSSYDEEDSHITGEEYFDRLFADIEESLQKSVEEYYRNKAQEEEDQAYIEAEEGRYGVYEDDDIMNEGIAAIDIDEMNGESDDNEPVVFDEDDKPPAKKVSSDPHFGDYATPDDVKTRGSVNYHSNKQKSNTSPKSERRRLREKRTKDMRAKDSRCHKKAATSSFM